jgi:hypothetical protein
MKMSNISLEELEEADNILLDAYNSMGSIKLNSFTEKTQLDAFLCSFNEIGNFLEKRGKNLVF